MSKEWTKFSVSEKSKETACTDITKGASYMAKGVHLGVHILDIAPYDNPDYPGVDITWSNDMKEVSRYRVFFTYKKDEEVSFSNSYKFLGAALCGADNTEQTEEETKEAIELFHQVFVKEIPDNPAFLMNLRGLRANIRIDDPPRGLQIRKVEGGVVVADIQTGETKEELSPETDGVFPSYQEARDTAIENNYRLSYAGIQGVTSNAEFIRSNQEQLRAALAEAQGSKDAQEAPVKPVSVFG